MARKFDVKVRRPGVIKEQEEVPDPFEPEPEVEIEALDIADCKTVGDFLVGRASDQAIRAFNVYQDIVQLELTTACGEACAEEIEKAASAAEFDPHREEDIWERALDECKVIYYG